MLSLFCFHRTVMIYYLASLTPSHGRVVYLIRLGNRLGGEIITRSRMSVVGYGLVVATYICVDSPLSSKE